MTRLPYSRSVAKVLRDGDTSPGEIAGLVELGLDLFIQERAKDSPGGWGIDGVGENPNPSTAKLTLWIGPTDKMEKYTITIKKEK